MEYLALVLVTIVGVIIGLAIGIVIGTERMRKAVEENSVGHLRIDRSEPDEPPRPFLEVKNATIETISQKDFVILKVINENYLSPN
jgi:hypothetical protein